MDLFLKVFGSFSGKKEAFGVREKKTARKKSLKGKLLVWFLVFALAPLGALAYFASQSFMETLVERQIEEYTWLPSFWAKTWLIF
jgi:hypothetical protein